MKTPPLVGSLMCGAWLALHPARVHAYTISTPLTDGCHESITTHALRAVRVELATAAPLAANENERALIDDLQFTPASDMNDLGGTTLLLAVRDNDLKGRSSQDLTELAEVHGDPAAQHEHCLRAGNHDEPNGSAAAVSRCRSFIRNRVLEALAGLDSSGKPDLAKRTRLGVYLALRHHVDATLPTYYVRIGQAIHAIQDSFTHTYRSADGLQITVVLNYLDDVGGDLVESRDGPAHATELDRCDDPDALRTTRRELATTASTEILRATLDPQKSADQKMAAVDGILDRYLGYRPGCTFDNGWCDAPERQYKDPAACGCTTVGKDGGRWSLLPIMALAGLGIARRRRRRAMPSRPASTALALVLTNAALFGVGPARAQSNAAGSPDAAAEPTTKTVKTPARPATPTSAAKPAKTITTTTTPGETPSTPATTATKTVTPRTTTMTVTSPTRPDEHRPPPPTLVPVPEPGPRDVSASAWGAFLGASASFDNPALASALGVRLRANNHWIFGLDGEWNPWIGHGPEIKPGVANVYATGIIQLPLAYENFNLRSSVSAGGSRLLMNLYGAPKGSTGFYFAASFLGIAWKMSRSFYLITNPVTIAIPIPQLEGVPLTYSQYRFTLGLEAYLGD